jgi:hypothetical protein
VSGDSRGTEAAFLRRKAAMQRGESPQPNTHRLRTRPGHQAQTTPVACVGSGDGLACLLAMWLPTHPRRHASYTSLAGPSVSALAGWEGGVACCGMLPSIMALGETLTTLHLAPYGNPQRGLPSWPEWVTVEEVDVPPDTSHSHLLRFRLRACCALAVSMQTQRG